MAPHRHQQRLCIYHFNVIEAELDLFVGSGCHIYNNGTLCLSYNAQGELTGEF